MNTRCAIRIIVNGIANGPGGAKSCSQGRQALEACGKHGRKPRRGDINRVGRRRFRCIDVAPAGLASKKIAPLPGARAPGDTTAPLRGYRTLWGIEPHSRTGFTLLEIILALAILAGSLAALGEVMRLADQNAAMTRDETQAQMIATSVMDELVSGARALTATGPAQFDPEWDPQWLYSVALEETGYVELVAVRVVAEQQLEALLQPARFELIRWLPNPDYVPPDAAADE